ncbi:MAG: glycosyl hydrolase 115 family protein [Mangrovibacterium sp.]
MHRKLILLTTLATLVLASCSTSGFEFKQKENIAIQFNEAEEPVVKEALRMFGEDFKRVFTASIEKGIEHTDLYIATLGNENWSKELIDAYDLETLKQQEEAFLLLVNNGKIFILGSDKRGTAYGILELSRLIGVSPWEWWADAKAEQKKSLVLNDGFKTLQYPSVARRGIFINDEDWGLMPWSSTNYEPTEVKGEIGPITNARIFELLLRLRANTYWPAMHKCSKAFFETPGNKEIADKYSIFVGTSHCEPMVRNTNAEWNREERGHYNYLTNKEGILNFWQERVIQQAQSDNIYTLGLRGEHDGKMEGAKTDAERMEVLTNVIADQRNMLAQYVNKDVEQISQVFIPYKEVLDAYKLGLQVPDDVTLMWCDDNYGYVRHFPTLEEQTRKGGNGLYYHISYWGRPHDYLWLATSSPAQIYSQMKLSYDKGNREMWVLNVGDIKPGEYLTEFFLDIAWNINSIEGTKKGLDEHLNHWLAREFGKEKAQELTHVMNEYYRLAYIRKPEHMGNTRVEEGKTSHWNNVSDLAWSEKQITERIACYQTLVNKIKELSPTIPVHKQSAWFQLVEYPVLAAAQMNFKHLYAQLARHGLANWDKSDAAYNSIVELTEQYSAIENGKWRGIMDMKPRNLSVFAKPEHTQATTSLVEEEQWEYHFNGNEYSNFNGEKPIENGLGYQRAAIYLPKRSTVCYEIQSIDADSLVVEIDLAPNHPVSGEQIRYTITIDDDQAITVNYATEGRSEEWKQNVLRNQAIRQTKHAIQQSKKHLIKLTAQDEGVVIDQIKIRKYHHAK